MPQSAERAEAGTILGHLLSKVSFQVKQTGTCATMLFQEWQFCTAWHKNSSSLENILCYFFVIHAMLTLAVLGLKKNTNHAIYTNMEKMQNILSGSKNYLYKGIFSQGSSMLWATIKAHGDAVVIPRITQDCQEVQQAKWDGRRRVIGQFRYELLSELSWASILVDIRYTTSWVV